MDTATALAIADSQKNKKAMADAAAVELGLADNRSV